MDLDGDALEVDTEDELHEVDGPLCQCPHTSFDFDRAPEGCRVSDCLCSAGWDGLGLEDEDGELEADTARVTAVLVAARYSAGSSMTSAEIEPPRIRPPRRLRPPGTRRARSAAAYAASDSADRNSPRPLNCGHSSRTRPGGWRSPGIAPDPDRQTQMPPLRIWPHQKSARGFW
jgi:hypothetical protein